MSKRVRLTERKRRAVEDNTPYPGTVNQPERTFKPRDKYDNWDEVVNHPLPDMRHEWKDNPRDEIGFGEPKGDQPTVASVRVAAGKAVKMAVLLLGEKVAEEVIEDQARDFMAMSGDSMDRTLSRFAETQELYASDDGDEDDEGGDSDPVEAAEEDKKEEESKEAAEDSKEEEESKEAAEEDSKDEESKEAAEEDKKEEESKEAAEESKEESKDEESKEAAEEESKDEESKEAAEEESKDDEESKEASDDADEDDESKEASDDADKDDEEKEASEKRTSTDMDIELTSAVDEVASDPESDAQLASLFEDPAVLAAEKEAQETEGSKKAGISKLGGQPKVAASKTAGVADISSIWDSAPDVSSVFE